MTDRDLQIQQIIEQNPGIQFREIMRTSGLKNGVLSHYLSKLEKNGIIKVMRGLSTPFFNPDVRIISRNWIPGFCSIICCICKSLSVISKHSQG